jgi:hypothetical protein
MASNLGRIAIARSHAVGGNTGPPLIRVNSMTGKFLICVRILRQSVELARGRGIGRART